MQQKVTTVKRKPCAKFTFGAAWMGAPKGGVAAWGIPSLRMLGALCAGLLLYGCATTPVPTSEAVEVPASRLLNGIALVRRADTGVVVIKRDAGFAASACTTRIFVDGVPIADIATGEKVTLHLTEGAHMLAGRANGVCIGGLVETSVVAVKGRLSAVRISYGSSGEFSIQPTAF